MGVSKRDSSFGDLQMPAIEDMQIQLEQLIQQGILTPEAAQAILQEQSELGNISTDPSLRNAQIEALNSLQDISASGGLTAMDRAKLGQIQTELGNQERGSREAIMQNAQARGVAGSGLELAQQLMNQQGSAMRGSQQGMDVAAQAQQRALEAIQQAGQLGGNIRQQDWNQQAQQAAAQDAINQFNAANKQNVNLQNVNTRNQAQQYNLDQRQNIANQNTGLRNQQQMHNKNLIQQDFENRYKKAGGKAQQAQANNQANQENANLIGGVIGSVAMASDERVKENVKEFDPLDFMDELTGYKYSYKNPEKHGHGEQVGIMAQDLERVAPQAVEEDGEGVKRVDFSKLGGPILASIAELNDRVKDVENGK